MTARNSLKTLLGAAALLAALAACTDNRSMSSQPGSSQPAATPPGPPSTMQGTPGSSTGPQNRPMRSPGGG